jgi:ubiquitin-conjugating enzyme E2 D/E
VIDGQNEFAGGKFIVELDFNDNFPFQAPKIKFLTKVYHPNISKEGGICT